MDSKSKIFHLDPSLRQISRFEADKNKLPVETRRFSPSEQKVADLIAEGNNFDSIFEVSRQTDKAQLRALLAKIFHKLSVDTSNTDMSEKLKIAQTILNSEENK